MYKFSAEGLEDKIKYAKPFSFFESVRHKFAEANLEENFLSKHKDDTRELNENAQIIQKEDKEDKEFKKQARMVKSIYENNLSYMSNVFSKINKANKKIEKKSEFITESFNRNIFEEKASKDLVYFKHILENILPEGNSKVYKELNETVLDLFKQALLESIELYQETNVKPRYLSPSLNMKDIEESKIIEIYNKQFSTYLTESYIIPLRKGSVANLEESAQIKKLTKYLIENGIEENIDNIVAYLPFENRVKEFLENILIPEPAKNRINYFVESQDLAYFDIFEKNAKTLTESLENVIEKISSLISPFLFKKSVDIDSDMNPTKYAGISMTCKKINDGPLECNVSKDSSEDGDGEDTSEVAEDIEDEIKKVEKISEDDAKEMEDDLEAKAIMGDDEPEIDDDDKSEDKEDKEDKDDIEKDIKNIKDKKKGKIEENEYEPGVDKTIPYNRDKYKKEINKEEVIPDEASDFTKLDSQVKEEK